MWNNTCKLGMYEEKVNEIGDLIKNINFNKEVFCNEKSVRYSEFYQAQAVGMKPEIILEIMAIDYEKEKYVMYEEEKYTVLKTYKKSSEKIELTLIRGVDYGNAT